MLGHLIRKEILDHISGIRFLILAAVGALAIWLSLYDGYAYYRERLQDHRLGEAWTEERIRQIKVDAGSEPSRLGYAIHKPPTPMSIFVRGMEPVLGRSSNTGWAEQIPRLKWSPAEMEPILGLFLPLDLGLVVQVVLSLFVVLLTYDAVCGEKEAGTLSLVASFPVPRHHLLLGKFFGVLFSTLTAFGLPLLAGTAAVLLAPDVAFTDAELSRVGLILLAFVLFLTAFVCAGLLASVLTHRSATSFVLLLVFWVSTVSVLPRLSLIVAEGIRPAPSIYEFQAKKAATRKEIIDRWRESKVAWVEKHIGPGKRWEDGTPESQEEYYLWNREEQRKIGERQAAQWDRLDEEFLNRYTARLNLAVAIARFSPAFALNNATSLLAGTGMDRHQRFFATYKRFRRRLSSDWMSHFTFQNILRRIRPDKYGKFEWDASGLPRFTYRETWPGEEVRSATVDIGVVALWGLVFFVGAYAAMLRYDLR